jgi:sulfoxide reductase heme-binding subunit YedZ
MNAWLSSRWTKAAAFLLCLVPIALVGWRAWQDDLTANPIEFLTHASGDWTLRFLLITLAVTPLRKLPGLTNLIRFRRMFGLFAFFYGCLHLTTYVWLDKLFDFAEMWKDVTIRKFITAGAASFLLMLPLALTSTAGWVRRLGGKNWQRLHYAIYFSAAAGVIHYVWLVKSDLRRPLTYGAILTLLLAWRAVIWLMNRRARA